MRKACVCLCVIILLSGLFTRFVGTEGILCVVVDGVERALVPRGINQLDESQYFVIFVKKLQQLSLGMLLFDAGLAHDKVCIILTFLLCCWSF